MTGQTTKEKARVSLVSCIFKWILPETAMGKILSGIVSLAVLLFISTHLYIIGRLTGFQVLLPGLLITILMLYVINLFLRSVFKLVRFKQNLLISFLLSSLAVITLTLTLTGKPLPISIFFSLLIVPVPTFFGASLGWFLTLKTDRLIVRILSIFFFAIATVLALSYGFWLLHPGYDDHLVEYTRTSDPLYQYKVAADPAEEGNYPVQRIYYGSGTDKRRERYADSVTIITETIDLNPYIPSISNFQRWYRAQYWGFDLNETPLNGIIWYPDGEGKFPLVLIVHGNHTMHEDSETGYEYLGRLLASRGYIVASIDQNFLNFSWLGEGFMRSELQARSILILEHLRLFTEWQKRESNPLTGIIDLDDIALIGHSRGGEAVAIAAFFNNLVHHPENPDISFDYHFSVRSLIALAPSDGFYRPGGSYIELEDVNYLLLQGAADGDLLIFLGARQYNRVRFTKDGYIKSLAYINRANHGYFNSGWGRTDLSFPFGLLLNRKQIMQEADQQRIAQVYVSAFLDSTLRGRTEYLPLFWNSDLFSEWLPENVIINRFADSAFQVITDFSEDDDPATTTLPGGEIEARGLDTWYEDALPLRFPSMKQSSRGVFLSWAYDSEDRSYPEYIISLSSEEIANWNLTPESSLVFSMTSTDLKQNRPVDFSIELSTSDGFTVNIPLSKFRNPLPLLELKSTKLGILERAFLQSAELIPNTYVLPLSAFLEREEEFNPGRVERISFIFDQTAQGEIVLTDIGFSPY